jgi:uncharacterized protein YjbI with pentapeptide repeats
MPSRNPVDRGTAYAMKSRIACLVLLLGTVIALVAGPRAAQAVTTPQRQKAHLELAKLREEVRQLRLANGRSASSWGRLLDFAPFLTVLVAVGGVVIPLRKESRERRDQRERELEQRQRETERSFVEQLAAAVGNLGADTEAIKVSGAVSLAGFLEPRYSAYHEQVFAVVRANLAIESHERIVNRFLVRAFERAAQLIRPRSEGQDERTGLDLAHCQLERAELPGVDFGTGCDVDNANLYRANLTHSNLYQVKGVSTNLEGARLSETNLQEARMRQVRGAGAHFHHARLVSARFGRRSARGSDFRGAEFYAAELQGAHFEEANLQRARFDRANLADAYFEGAQFSRDTLISILRVAKIDGTPSWRKAHFDEATWQRLNDLSQSTGST